MKYFGLQLVTLALTYCIHTKECARLVESSSESDDSSDTVSVPTSCADLEDGEYMLQLIDDDSYPLIWAQCSNGYTILDYSKDNDWTNYLSSYKRVYKTTGAPQKVYLSRTLPPFCRICFAYANILGLRTVHHTQLLLFKLCCQSVTKL